MAGSGMLPLVRRWWWLILGVAAAAGVLAWVVASREQKTYQADVSLLVGPVSADLPTVQAAGALGRTYAELAHSRRVVIAASHSAGVKLSRKEVDSAVSATSNDVTRIVDVQARNTNPQAAVRLADAIVQQLNRLRASPPAQSGDSVDAIMRDPGVLALSPKAQKTVRSAVVGVVGSPDVGNLQVVGGPVKPTHPVSPKTPLLVLLAALAGALLASVYALVREGLVASADADRFEGFEVENLFRSANGVVREHPAAAPEESEDVRSGELP